MTIYLYRPKHPNADENGMVPLSIAGPKYESRAAPGVISDTMEPLKHHGTGRILDSKSAFRQDTKSVGAVETGNEPIRPRKPIALDRGQRREAIRHSIYNLRNGIKQGNN